MADDSTKKGPASAGPAPRGRGRPRKGTLVWSKQGWCARVPTLIDGEIVRVWHVLGTDNKTVARRKLARIMAQQAQGEIPKAEESKAIESMDAYAVPWLDARDARGLPTAKNERRYYERVWRPAVGRLALDAVKASHIQGVINDAATGRLLSTKGKRYSRESILQMRAAILRMLESAWKEELLTENRAKRTEVPELDETKKPRAVLTDAEIGLFLGHPHVDAELKLLILMSRTIGGMRTGDLNTLTWDAFDPEFTTCTFVRRKTRKKKPTPQGLEVPETVRPFIKAWWEVSKRPAGGPVFPVRRGERAGLAKLQSKQSYADRLRRNLRVAFGLDAWNAISGRFEPVAAREPTPRERDLLEGSATTQAVDFHSTRRAYATSLARVGVNAQTAMALTGHSDPKVHQRYVETASIRALPAAAIPYVNPSSAAFVANGFKPERVTKTEAKRKKPAETLSQPADLVKFSGAGEEIRTLDVHLGKPAEEAQQAENKRSQSPGEGSGEPEQAPTESPWPKSVTEFDRMNSAGFVAMGRRAADAALVAYLGVLAVAIAGVIGA